MKTNTTAMQAALAAGFAIAATCIVSNSAQAQGAGNRRVFRPLPSRSAASSSSGYMPGQAGNNPNMMGSGANGGANANGSGIGANGMGGMGGGGNRGGNDSQTPLAVGTITAGDASTGRIQIQLQSSGNSQTLQVTNATRIVTQTAITTSDLQTGEWVQIKGTAANTTGTASITASAITAGQIPAFLHQDNHAPSMGGNGQEAGSNASGTSGNTSKTSGNTSGIGRATSGRTATAQSNAAASNSTTTTLAGMITSVSPLVVTLHNGTSVTIKTASDAQVNRITPLLFRNLQVGDQLKATGMATSNSAFVLTDVAINM